MVEKFGLPVSASIKETGASKKEKELTPDELLEKEAEKISMDMNREGMKGEIERLKKKIAEINEAEKKNSGVKIADKRGGAEVVSNGRNEEVANIEKDIQALENDLKNIENKKRAKDLGEEIRKLEAEAGKKYAGEGYIDKTEASFDQQIAEKEAELKKMENIISGGKESLEEKTEEKTEEPKKDEETKKRTMEEVEKEQKQPTEILQITDERLRDKEANIVPVKEQAFEGISKEQDTEIMRLGKEMEAARRAYIVKDHTMDKSASIFKKFFGIGKRAQLGEFNAEYDLARKNYEEATKAYKDALMGIVGDREEAEMMGDWINRGEQAELQGVRADVKVENAHWPDKLVGKYLNVVEGYRKMNWKQKLLVGGALMGVGVAAGAAGGVFAVMGGGVLGLSRLVSMSASSAGMKAMFEGISKKRMDKEAKARTNEDISWSMERGVLNFEEYKNRLDEKIKGVDQELQSRKQWDKWRNWMAVGAGVSMSFAFRYLGKGASAWVSEKFGLGGGAGATVKPETGGAGGRPGLSYDEHNKIFGAEDLNQQNVAPETGEFPQGEAPAEAPVEAPVETPVKAPGVEQFIPTEPEIETMSPAEQLANEARVIKSIGLSPEEYGQIKSVKIGELMSKIPSRDAVWAAVNAEGGNYPELPHDGVYGMGELGRQITLAEYLHEFNPSGEVNDMTIEDFLKEHKPGTAILRAVGMNGDEYVAIQDVKVGELLEKLPSKDEVWAAVNSEGGSYPKLPHDGVYGMNELNRQVELADYIRSHNLTPEQLKNMNVREFLESTQDNASGGHVDLSPVAEIHAVEQVVPGDARIANIIGFTENEYNQIKTVKVRDLLKTMPIGDNPRGLSGLNVRGTAFDLPQDGFPGPLEMARQLDLANYINEFHPTGAMNNMTVEEFLQKNPPGKNIFKILMLDPGDYQEIQGKSVDELLKEVPSSKDASFFEKQSMAEKIQVADYIRGHKLTPEMRSMSIKEFLEGNSATGDGGQVASAPADESVSDYSKGIVRDKEPSMQKKWLGNLFGETDQEAAAAERLDKFEEVGYKEGLSRDTIVKRYSLAGDIDRWEKIKGMTYEDAYKSDPENGNFRVILENAVKGHGEVARPNSGETLEDWTNRLNELKNNPHVTGGGRAATENIPAGTGDSAMKEMQGNRPYNADELIKETDKMETAKEHSGTAKTPAQMYDEAMKNREGATRNVDSETAQSGRKSFPPHDREFDSKNATKEVIDETNAPPHEQPAPNVEKGFPYPKETVAQGNEYLHRGYTEESLRKIASAGPLDGKPTVNGRMLEVVGKNGKSYEVLINHDSKMAAHYALDAKEDFAKAAQKISGGDINKWNAIKDQPVEQVMQSEVLTHEDKRRLLKYRRLEGAIGRTVKDVIKRALKRGLGGGYY